MEVQQAGILRYRKLVSDFRTILIFPVNVPSISHDRLNCLYILDVDEFDLKFVRLS